MDGNTDNQTENANELCWVGVKHDEIFVYDMREQVAAPEIVHLWSLKTLRMGSYKAVFMKVDLNPIKDPIQRANSIFTYQFNYKSLLTESIKKQSIRNYYDAFYYHPKKDEFSNFFFDGYDLECSSFDSILLSTAKKSRPRRPLATASAFAQWVFNLYHRNEPRALKRKFDKYNESGLGENDLTIEEKFHMAMGVFTEKSIEELKLWINHDFPRTMCSQWRVIFVDLKDDSYRMFLASRLCVSGQPLRCIPDVVLQNYSTGDILIIERKSTSVPESKVPPMGWANLRVQLWCYSWIDDWIDAPNVYLIGQIWKMPGYEIFCNQRWNFGFHRLNIFPRWDRSDPCFNSRCQALFELYGGKILN